MSSTDIPVALRQLVYERANAQCEYCLIPESVVFAPHEIDHIIAEKHGGPTEANNLALSCMLCIDILPNLKDWESYESLANRSRIVLSTILVPIHRDLTVSPSTDNVLPAAPKGNFGEAIGIPMPVGIFTYCGFYPC